MNMQRRAWNRDQIKTVLKDEVEKADSTGERHGHVIDAGMMKMLAMMRKGGGGERHCEGGRLLKYYTGFEQLPRRLFGALLSEIFREVYSDEIYGRTVSPPMQRLFDKTGGGSIARVIEKNMLYFLIKDRTYALTPRKKSAPSLINRRITEQNRSR